MGGHDDGVVLEPVEEADRDGVFGQEPAPFLEGPVRADAEGASFVGGGDEPEEALTSNSSRVLITGNSACFRRAPAFDASRDAILASIRMRRNSSEDQRRVVA